MGIENLGLQIPSPDKLRNRTEQAIREKEMAISKAMLDSLNRLPQLIDEAAAQGKYSCIVYRFESYKEENSMHWWRYRPKQISHQWRELLQLAKCLEQRGLTTRIDYLWKDDWVNKDIIRKSDNPDLLEQVREFGETTDSIKAIKRTWALSASWNK